MIEVRVRIDLVANRARDRVRPDGAAARTIVRWARRWLDRHRLVGAWERPPVVSVHDEHADYFVRNLRVYRIEVWAR